VRQHDLGAVEDFILPHSAVYLRIQKWKNYWIRSTFAKVIVKIKVAQFFLTHSVYMQLGTHATVIEARSTWSILLLLVLFYRMKVTWTAVCTVCRSVVCFMIWQAMEHTGSCVALSEPPATHVLATMYQKSGDSPQLRQLARDIIRWECHPNQTMQPPPLDYFVKLPATCFVLLPMLR